MNKETISAAEAARLIGIPEEEARDLADTEGRVPLDAARRRAGEVVLALELARAREEVGGLLAQLKEVRNSNLQLQKELNSVTGERRRLTEEVLELRAAAEERLMLMERIERISHIEQELEETKAELGRLYDRGLLSRLLNR